MQQKITETEYFLHVSAYSSSTGADLECCYI